MNGKGIHITSKVIGGFFAIAFICIIASHDRNIQKKVSMAAGRKLESVIDGKVSFESLKISAYGSLVLNKLLILDNKPYVADTLHTGYAPSDTIFYADRISATFTLAGLFRHEGLHLGRVRIKDAGLFLISEPEWETGRKNNLAAILKPKPPIDSDYVAVPGPAIFDVRRVSVDGFRFRMVNFSKEPREAKESGELPSGINLEDLDVSVGSLRCHSLAFTGGRLGGTIDHLDAAEKTGFIINDLSGTAISGLGKTEVDDLHIDDGASDIHLDSLNFIFKNMLDFGDFVNRVNIEAGFSPSSVAISSVNWFSRGSLDGNGLVFDISGGSVKGPVNDLKVSNLVFTETLTGVRGSADAALTSIVPDINGMGIDAEVKDCSFTTKSISEFLNNWSKSGKGMDLGGLAAGEPLTAVAGCSGNINSLNVRAVINGPALGGLQFDGLVSDAVRKAAPIDVKGHIITDSLNVGKTLSNDNIGILNAEGAFSVRLSNPMLLSLDSLAVSSLDAIGYTFHGIDVKADLEDETASAQIASADPALTASITGLVDLAAFNGRRRLKLAAGIDMADLHALGLDKRGDVSSISADIFSSFVQEGGRLMGDCFIDKIKADSGNGPAEIGDITLRAFQRDGNQQIRFNSPFADIDYTGGGNLADIAGDIQDITIRKCLPAIAGKTPQKDSWSDCELDVTLRDTRTILDYLKPGLYISDSTSVRMSVRDGLIDASVKTPRIALGPRFAKDLALDLSSDSSSVSTGISVGELNAGGIVLQNPSLVADAFSDSVQVSLKYDNLNGSDGFGNLKIGGAFSRDENGGLVIDARPTGSEFGAEGDVWTISDSGIHINGKDFSFDKFNISNGNQSLLLDGGFSLDKADTLGVFIDSLQLGIIDSFLSEKIGIRGITTGQALLTSPSRDRFGMLLNVGCDSLEVSGTKAGTFRITSFWNEADEKIYAILRNTLNGSDIFTAEGNYRPKTKEFGAGAEFSDFALSVAAPLLKNIFTETGGTLSGSIIVSGKDKDISVSSSDIHLNDARMMLGATGVAYTLNGPIKVDDSGIYLDAMEIRDNGSGRGTLSGAVHHTKLSNLSLDASARLRDLHVLNLPEGSGLSGNLHASGDLKITGPFNALAIDASLTTSDNGSIRIPLSGSQSSSKNDLLTFKEPDSVMDPYEEMLKEQSIEAAEKTNDISIRSRIQIPTGLDASVAINKSTGNVLRIVGGGEMDVFIRPAKKKFDLNGLYNVENGNYHFVVPGLLEKDFEIQKGSFVKMGGDVNDAEFSINAVYETHTSLSTLLADTTVVANRRLVQCGLGLTGRLSSPKINFSVTVPDLDPTTKSKVDGALNTEDKIQKQFVALLLFGSFLPDEQAGVFNESNILYSNLSEIMSGQINSIFQKLDIPLDIGLGYQETRSGSNAFDVAVSTQLFNNRLIVNGSVGNRRGSGQASGSGDVVGDVDIEFKLDKEGKFRVSAFSHSADQYTSYLDKSQRNGIGASFQQEFTTFGDFFRKLFTGKKRRQQMEAEALANPEPETGYKIIKIQNDEPKAIPDSLDLR